MTSPNMSVDCLMCSMGAPSVDMTLEQRLLTAFVLGRLSMHATDSNPVPYCEEHRILVPALEASFRSVAKSLTDLVPKKDGET